MSKPILIAGGTISALISIMHFILAVKPAWYRYISAGVESDLARMAESGSTGTTIATVALGVIFGVWAGYAFSGAGLIGPLPLQRVVLSIIATIYILRSLFVIQEINMVRTQGYSFRFVVFSMISLVTGLLYLVGVVLKR